MEKTIIKLPAGSDVELIIGDTYYICTPITEQKPIVPQIPIQPTVREDIEETEICPQCGKKLVPRTGKYGTFKACSGYPNCDYIQSKKRG